MPLHLIEGLDMWNQELGESDIILVCGSYAFGKKDNGLSKGYGYEANRKFPQFVTDVKDHMKFLRKPMKGLANHIYGAFVPEKASYETTTKIGIYQICHLPGEDVDINLLAYSMKVVANMASKYSRIALEYPSKEVHGSDESKIYPYLSRLPENCVFYSPCVATDAIDYAAIGQSYAMGIKYAKT